MSPILSIIIPAYNVSNYLEICLQSVLAQQLPQEQYEIIVVDDGSTDGTSALADEWQKRLSNLIVIHQTNQGLPAARNAGLKVCQGRWIMLVDSDDQLVEGSLKGVLEQCEKKEVEVMRVGYECVCDGRVVGSNAPYTDGGKIMDGRQWLNEQMDFYCYVWRWIVRRDLIMAHHLYFTPGITYEDVDWTPRLLLAAKRVGSTDKVVYAYQWREGSLTHPRTEEENRQVIANHIDMLQRLQTKREQGLRWVDSMSSGVVVAILTLVAKTDYDRREEVMKKIQAVYDRRLSCQRSFALLDRVKIRIAGISPRVYCGIRRVIYLLTNK